MTPEISNHLSLLRCGEIPKGYLKQNKRLIPDGWKLSAIEEIAEITSGSTPNRKKEEYWNGTIPWVTTGEIAENSLIISTLEKVTDLGKTKANLQLLPINTILMAMYGQGKTRGTVALLEIPATVNQACAAIIVNAAHCKFVFYQLQNAYDDIRSLSNTGSQENLNVGIIKRFKILLGSIEEQRKIAAILSAQDKIIELKEKRIAEKQRQKKYLMQQLLTGKRRLAGFDTERKTTRLHQITERIYRKNTVNNTNVLTISAQHGLISQSDFFNKTVASDNKSNYFLLKRDDFAYNKSYSNGYPLGTIKRLKKYDIGIVSPLYICFSIKGNDVSLAYLEQYFEAGLLNGEINAVAQEGARNHGLLNISTDDFFNARINLPEIKEQDAIADILTAADRELDLLQQDLEQEQKKKKALMQLLLTGIVRVKS